MPLLSPKTLASVKDLRLVAKTVVDGVLLGAHQSRRSGAGMEFSEHRPYQLGDDARRVDWKLAARSDKFFVRESEAETSVAVRIMLDASASMASEEDGVSKFDCARWLAAAIGYLAYQQGDAIGLCAMRNESAFRLPARRDKAQLNLFFNALETLAPQGKWADWSKLRSALCASNRRELVVFISDMHERADEILSTIRAFANLKNDVVAFHLVGKKELNFDYEGDMSFEDLETGEIIETNAEDAREAYKRNLSDRLKTLENAMLSERIAYQRIVIQEPIDEALRQFLLRRNRLPR
ncbi:MAG: DUF58 domain-containing protein [Chloroherpetonaceae bacterium]|nr:DUF58 domain-containing protein [Chloroherpetonaceae bacterium]MDW8436861.1 DUF58 domain-containing protein [Chloroherpetonaceae bacterium]